MASRRRLTVLSAFSGIGGMDLGLKAAGFATVGCIESDELARASLKANREAEWRLLEPYDISDVAAELKPKDLGLRRRELSLLAGGPPCQPFSKAAQWATSARSGLEDPRAECLSDFLALVETFLPRVLLIENVPGFVNGEVSALAFVRRKLYKMNSLNNTCYEPQYSILNAADYGVPQHRVRAIIVAMRDGGLFQWPKPTHSDQPVTAWDAIGNIDPGSSVPEAMGKWASLLPSIPEGENYLWHTKRGGGKPLFGYRTRYWSFLLKLARDRPSWTIPAQPGPSTGPFHWANRPLAIPEMLALQTFPVDWSVEGDYRSQVRQVGNATPPLLAEIIGRAVALQSFQVKESAPLCYALATRSDPPNAARPTSVPAKYMEFIGDHKDHPGTGRGPSPRTSVHDAQEDQMSLSLEQSGSQPH